MSLQQIVVYNHRKLTRNSLIDVEDYKSEEFRKINPNGRLPAIVDPNNGNFTLWESGAIAEYLVETYDKSMKLSVSGDAEKWQLKQFLHFQMSGQGPYYGQAAWFHMAHGQDIPSAKKRYLEQIDRVWSVMNDILKDNQYFLGSKLTYVDLCFFPWEFSAHSFLGEYLEAAGFDAKKKYPNYWAWFERLKTQHSVKTIYGLCVGPFLPGISPLKVKNPPRRDTALLPGSGYFVIGFVTDNPGAWLMHCHIGYHVEMGSALQILERADELSALVDQDGLSKGCDAWSAFQRDNNVIQDDSGV
ncbi:hypothetical protein MY4824_009093 [Beauveria thailandica]